MAEFDLKTARGRLFAYLDFLWRDHAYLRLGFQNAHWVSDELVRSNQPWPHQLRAWKRRGVRTVVNLRGGFDASFHALEKDACAKLGLTLVNFTLTSRDAPDRAQMLAARRLFETVEYPVLIHCKSGADRASLMSALYVHFRRSDDIPTAMRQLDLRYLHLKHGRTGILDYLFERYLAEGAPQGRSFTEWVESPAYDPAAIKAAYQARTRKSRLADLVPRE
ncbi:fused DSP-PTPase phosphatase/NAD kinase-like protein [Phenylobacterium sp.]|uniref:fused DSP-PTPase phosphatase/NAD kinase-like protein n=1 Tax=Phenylobacterium sp. TaxID=1871053 RepID=UPI002E379141|nr:sulfur transferase domain-containing protein [Phenylobacterium sp.]HEX3364447.1 sulfur transferase domain-containing protein [Phenylobacterium sp.]